MIYSYTKCESVIAKIMADLDISEKDIRITDIREWIFEAVDKIGAPVLYILKESGMDNEPVLKIEDRQVQLPHGIQSLDAVAFSTEKNGPWIPMRSNTGSFKNVVNNVINTEVSLKDPIGANYQLMQNEAKKQAPKYALVNQDPTYFLKPGWLVTNQDKGYVKIAYKTIATDGRGYPLIPDTESYKEAIYWYVTMKLTFPKWLKGMYDTKRAATGAQYAYTYIQQQWNFYRNQAYAEAMMPNADQVRSIKNDWSKLLPEYDSDDTFFTSQGKQQLNYNDYYYGY